MSSATAKAKAREERLARMRTARARRREREYEIEGAPEYDPREPFPLPIPQHMRELRGYGGQCCVPPLSARMPVIDSETLRSLRGDSKKRKTRKKRRSRGKGRWCVYSKGGKLVRCYEKKTTAHKVRKGFGRSFKVKRRK